MKRILDAGRSLLREEDGIAVTEYGLLIAIVAVGLIAILRAFGTQLQAWFTRVTSQLTTS
jgi:pilus assembly protein Flp/PilA